MGYHVYVQKPLSTFCLRIAWFCAIRQEDTGLQRKWATREIRMKEYVRFVNGFGQEPLEKSLMWMPGPIAPYGLQGTGTTEKRTTGTQNTWTGICLSVLQNGGPTTKFIIRGHWRGWWDFGTGALGDMACHILDPVFKSLNLGYPASVQGSSTPVNTESAPNAEFVQYEFPRRDNLPKVAMPAVTVNWYDGGLMPPRPDELEAGEQMGDDSGGCIFYGTNGKIMCGTYAQKPTLAAYQRDDPF